MSDDRRTAAHRGSSAPTPADARQSIVQAWKHAGWPQPPRSRADYLRLQERMTAYLAVAFPKVDSRCRGHIVGQTLRVFMAPLHARRPRHEWPEPEALVSALEDAVLDRAEEVPPGRDEDDQRVALLAFRSTPAGVRAGLTALAAEGKAADYRMVTKYLDLVDLDRSRPPDIAHVVAGLRPAAVTEQMVRQVLQAFRRRVEAVMPDDNT